MRVLRGLALVVGLVAFAVTAYRLGWTGLTHVVVNTGWWFLVIALIDTGSVLCDGAAIRALASDHARVPYARCVAAQLGGVAINRLTPGNALGEPVKISLLVEHVPRGAAVSTILMFDAGAAVIAIGGIVIGSIVTLLVVDLPATTITAAWLGAGALLLVLAGVWFLVRRGPARWGIRALRAIRVISEERRVRWTTATAHVDDMVRELGRTRSSRLGLLGLFGARCLNWAGTLVLLYAAGLPISAPIIVGMLSVGTLVNQVAQIVPLGLGIAEGGNYVLYRALGAPGLAGLDFTMVQRARTIVLSAIGLGVLAITTFLDRRRRATVES